MTHYEDYIDALIEKDEEAFEAIYEASKRAVYAMIFSIVHERIVAEDLMQDTYMTMIEKIHQYKRGHNFLTWLLVIARNKALDHLRAHKKETLVDIEIVENLGSNVLAKGEENAIVQDMLSRLTDIEKQIFLLYLSENLKFSEIAKLLIMPLGTVLWHYNKAKTKIKNYKEEK